MLLIAHSRMLTITRHAALFLYVFLPCVCDSSFSLSLMEMIADGLGSSRQLEFYLRWLAAVLSAHGQWLMLHRPSLMPTFRTVRKNLTTQQEALSRM